ncbi:MAG: amidinotransferase [Deltaproteobacteria bacterium]|nr:amidinotransferase [Deltaproteobacteria bacterium]
MSRDESTEVDPLASAAFGGPQWSPRVAASREEMGTLWRKCGVDSESAALRAVLLHRPGRELDSIENPDAVQMLATIDAELARQQHASMAQAYRDAGVSVHLVDPESTPPPNLVFVADLMFMTPEGAIVGRPASTVRAGEERFVARRLAELGIPILRTVHGRGTFEGADAAWLDAKTVLLATGLRTNTEGANQVASTLRELGVDVEVVGLPHGAMHLMGVLRFADPKLAIAWPGRVPWAAVDALKARGYEVLFLPSEVSPGMALNFVTLGPRSILMPADNPITQAFYEQAGIQVRSVRINELIKAAGGVACMTGVIERG